MKVIIVGTGHESSYARQVIEANEKLGCKVVLWDNKPYPETLLESLRGFSRIYEEPKHLFPKPKSKYHK